MRSNGIEIETPIVRNIEDLDDYICTEEVESMLYSKIVIKLI